MHLNLSALIEGSEQNQEVRLQAQKLYEKVAFYERLCNVDFIKSLRGLRGCIECIRLLTGKEKGQIKLAMLCLSKGRIRSKKYLCDISILSDMELLDWKLKRLGLPGLFRDNIRNRCGNALDVAYSYKLHFGHNISSMYR